MREIDENKALLLDRGMSEKEVENFLTPGNKVVYIKLLLPGGKVSDILGALSQVSIVKSPVMVEFCLSQNRIEEFNRVAGEASGRGIVNGVCKPGELVN